jgi:hypothetical protein
MLTIDKKCDHSGIRTPAVGLFMFAHVGSPNNDQTLIELQTCLSNGAQHYIYLVQSKSHSLTAILMAVINVTPTTVASGTPPCILAMLRCFAHPLGTRREEPQAIG